MFTCRDFFNRFVNSVAYYGISLNAKNLGGSLHFNVSLLLIVGVPAMFFMWLLFKKYKTEAMGEGPIVIGSTYDYDIVEWLQDC